MEEEYEKYIALIDLHLEGKMSKADLYHELNQIENPTIKKKLTNHVVALTNIRIDGEQQLKKKFRDLLNDTTLHSTIELEEVKTQVTHLRKVMTLAAIGLILLSSLFLYRNMSEDTVSDSYLAEDPSITILRSSDNPSFNDHWKNAMTAFANKEYVDALRLIDISQRELEDSKKHAGKIALYRGVSNVRLKEYNKAISSFLKIGPANPYYDQRQWYMAIAYLENGDHENALKELEKIREEPSHYKFDDADQLIKSLK